MNTTSARFTSMVEHAVKWSVIFLLGYWTVYALVVPVTIWDAQTYNVARLLIARDGGLFGNTGWNSEHQAAFPWGYDAVHYPFLFLGFGYALPSFACLVGVLVIVFQLVRKSSGEKAAWWSCLALLSLPALVYQATSTKNDIPLLFGAFCWYYALDYWKSSKRPVYLLFMAMALGFTAGAKSTGLLSVPIMAAFTCWKIGRDRRELARFAIFLALSLLLLGSSEAYVYNIITHHHILGSDKMVRANTNHDGLTGGLATAVRIFFGLINIGFDVAHPAAFSDWMSNVCRGVLRFLHLRDVGYFSNWNDDRFHFIRDRGEASSDFGPVGMLALFCAMWTVARCRVNSTLWKLSAAGFLLLGIFCYIVEWNPWYYRYILVPMTLFTLAFILRIVRDDNTLFYRCAAAPLLLLLLFSATAFPWYSYNKGPADIRLSIVHREEMMMKENPPMLEVVQDIEAIPRREGPALVLLHAEHGTWILPILLIPLKEPALQVMPAPEITDKTLATARERAAGHPIYIITLNDPIDADPSSGFVVVKDYPASKSTLLELKQPLP